MSPAPRGGDLYAALAALQAAAYAGEAPRPWSAMEIGALVEARGAILCLPPRDPRGFALLRAAGGEAELLALAVDPAMRGRGLGAALLAGGEAAAAALGAGRLFLEVAETARAARALYARGGYAVLGRRRAYYGAVDALTLAKTLPPTPPR